MSKQPPQQYQQLPDIPSSAFANAYDRLMKTGMMRDANQTLQRLYSQMHDEAYVKSYVHRLLAEYKNGCLLQPILKDRDYAAHTIVHILTFLDAEAFIKSGLSKSYALWYLLLKHGDPRHVFNTKHCHDVLYFRRVDCFLNISWLKLMQIRRKRVHDQILLPPCAISSLKWQNRQRTPEEGWLPLPSPKYEMTRKFIEVNVKHFPDGSRPTMIRKTSDGSAQSILTETKASVTTEYIIRIQDGSSDQFKYDPKEILRAIDTNGHELWAHVLVFLPQNNLWRAGLFYRDSIQSAYISVIGQYAQKLAEGTVVQHTLKKKRDQPRRRPGAFAGHTIRGRRGQTVRVEQTPKKGESKRWQRRAYHQGNVNLHKHHPLLNMRLLYVAARLPAAHGFFERLIQLPYYYNRLNRVNGGALKRVIQHIIRHGCVRQMHALISSQKIQLGDFHLRYMFHKVFYRMSNSGSLGFAVMAHYMLLMRRQYFEAKSDILTPYDRKTMVQKTAAQSVPNQYIQRSYNSRGRARFDFYQTNSKEYRLKEYHSALVLNREWSLRLLNRYRLMMDVLLEIRDESLAKDKYGLQQAKRWLLHLDDCHPETLNVNLLHGRDGSAAPAKKRDSIYEEYFTVIMTHFGAERMGLFVDLFVDSCTSDFVPYAVDKLLGLRVTAPHSSVAYAYDAVNSFRAKACAAMSDDVKLWGHGGIWEKADIPYNLESSQAKSDEHGWIETRKFMSFKLVNQEMLDAQVKDKAIAKKLKHVKLLTMQPRQRKDTLSTISALLQMLMDFSMARDENFLVASDLKLRASSQPSSTTSLLDDMVDDDEDDKNEDSSDGFAVLDKASDVLALVESRRSILIGKVTQHLDRILLQHYQTNIAQHLQRIINPQEPEPLSMQDDEENDGANSIMTLPDVVSNAMAARREYPDLPVLGGPNGEYLEQEDEIANYFFRLRNGNEEMLLRNDVELQWPLVLHELYERVFAMLFLRNKRSIRALLGQCKALGGKEFFMRSDYLADMISCALKHATLFEDGGLAAKSTKFRRTYNDGNKYDFTKSLRWRLNLLPMGPALESFINTRLHNSQSFEQEDREIRNYTTYEKEHEHCGSHLMSMAMLNRMNPVHPMAALPKNTDYSQMRFPITDLDVMLLRQSYSTVGTTVEKCSSLIGKISYFYAYAREHNIPVLKLFQCGADVMDMLSFVCDEMGIGSRILQLAQLPQEKLKNHMKITEDSSKFGEEWVRVRRIVVAVATLGVINNREDISAKALSLLPLGQLCLQQTDKIVRGMVTRGFARTLYTMFYYWTQIALVQQQQQQQRPESSTTNEQALAYFKNIILPTAWKNHNLRQQLQQELKRFVKEKCVHWTDYRFFPTVDPINNQRSHDNKPESRAVISKRFDAEVRKFFSREQLVQMELFGMYELQVMPMLNPECDPGLCEAQLSSHFTTFHVIHNLQASQQVQTGLNNNNNGNLHQVVTMPVMTMQLPQFCAPQLQFVDDMRSLRNVAIGMLEARIHADAFRDEQQPRQAQRLVHAMRCLQRYGKEFEDPPELSLMCLIRCVIEKPQLMYHKSWTSLVDCCMTYRAATIAKEKNNSGSSSDGRQPLDPFVHQTASAAAVIVDDGTGNKFVFESEQYLKYLTNTMDKPNNIRQFLVSLDEGLVGTKFYMGFAAFWNDRYKHQMHVYNNEACRELHRTLLFGQIPLDGASHYNDNRVESVCNTMQQQQQVLTEEMMLGSNIVLVDSVVQKEQRLNPAKYYKGLSSTVYISESQRVQNVMRFLCDKNISDEWYSVMFIDLSPTHVVRLIVDRATKNIARYFYVNTYRDATVRPIDAEYCVQALCDLKLQKHMSRVMTHLMDEKGVGGKGGQTYYDSLMGESEVRPWNQSHLMYLPQMAGFQKYHQQTNQTSQPATSYVTNVLSVFRRREALMTQLRELLQDMKNMDEMELSIQQHMDLNQQQLMMRENFDRKILRLLVHLCPPLPNQIHEEQKQQAQQPQQQQSRRQHGHHALIPPSASSAASGITSTREGEERTLVRLITELNDAKQRQREMIHENELLLPHKHNGRYNPVYDVLKKHELVLPVGHIEDCLQEGVVSLDSLYLPQH